MMISGYDPTSSNNYEYSHTLVSHIIKGKI